jgi:hypothetical protein
MLRHLPGNLNFFLGNVSLCWNVDAGGSFQGRLVHHLLQFQFSPHHSPIHGRVVVQNLVDLDAPLFEFQVEAILQVGLAKPPVLVVVVFGEDLSNMAPF